MLSVPNKSFRTGHPFHFLLVMFMSQYEDYAGNIVFFHIFRNHFPCKTIKNRWHLYSTFAVHRVTQWHLMVDGYGIHDDCNFFKLYKLQKSEFDLKETSSAAGNILEQPYSYFFSMLRKALGFPTCQRIMLR